MPFSEDGKPVGALIAGWWPIIAVAMAAVFGYGQLNARVDTVRDRVAVLEGVASGNSALAVQLAALTERLASLEREVTRVTTVLERRNAAVDRSQAGASYPQTPGAP